MTIDHSNDVDDETDPGTAMDDQGPFRLRPGSGRFLYERQHLVLGLSIHDHDDQHLFFCDQYDIISNNTYFFDIKKTHSLTNCNKNDDCDDDYCDGDTHRKNISWNTVVRPRCVLVLNHLSVILIRSLTKPALS